MKKFQVILYFFFNVYDVYEVFDTEYMWLLSIFSWLGEIGCSLLTESNKIIVDI